MILIAFVLVVVGAIALIAFSHSHRQMNLVCITEALLFLGLATYLFLSGQIPVSTFLIGSQYFFIDHLGIYEVLITTIVFLLAAIYAGGYVEGLLESGELGKNSLRLFYAAWALLLLVIVLSLPHGRTSMRRSSISSSPRSPCSSHLSASSSSSRSPDPLLAAVTVPSTGPA